MRDITDGWQVRLVEDQDTFARDGVRLLTMQPAGPDLARTVVALGGDSPTLVQYDRRTWPAHDGEQFRGLWLPRGLAEAIAAAVTPGPSAEVLRVMAEALDVERRRVDRMLPDVVVSGRIEHLEGPG